MAMRVAIQEDVIAVPRLRTERLETGASGGYVTFEGVVRHDNEGKRVAKLHYECFEPLAVKEIQRIVAAAYAQHDLHFVEVVHRTGTLQIGDIAVFIQVYAAHRKEAFQACMQIIDELKQTVPIWKKEFYTDGTVAWPHCHGCSQPHE